MLPLALLAVALGDVSLTCLGIIPLAGLRLAPAIFTRLLPLALLTVALRGVSLAARKLTAILELPCSARKLRAVLELPCAAWNRSLRQSARGSTAGSISTVSTVGFVLFLLRRLRNS